MGRCVPFPRKQKELSIGVYPEVTLVAAREAWELARKTLKAGTDPGAAKQAAKAGRLEAAKQTFEVTAREWHQMKLRTWGEGTAANHLHRLETDIFPEFGSTPISLVTSQQVLAALRKIEKRGELEVSNRIRGLVVRIPRANDRPWIPIIGDGDD